jgi:large subunit ribosomal protein L6
MSRVGKQPVLIPEGVTVKIEGNRVVVSGPKGTLEQQFRPELKIAVQGDKVMVSPKSENRLTKALWGTTRTLIANMIEGITQGFEKTLKLVGTGFRAKMEQEKLIMSLGFSHPVVVIPPPGIKLETPDQETIKISGADKVLVGQTAAKIRNIRPPEPYKGKGIRFEDEEVRKKPGKAGKVGVAGFGVGERQ